MKVLNTVSLNDMFVVTVVLWYYWLDIGCIIAPIIVVVSTSLNGCVVVMKLKLLSSLFKNILCILDIF